MITEKRGATDCCTLQTPHARPLVQLIATAGLALSTIVAATAVSIGIARAEAFGMYANGETAPLAIVLLIGLLLAIMGGLHHHHGKRARAERLSSSY
jgi:hypothetical protein